MGAPIKDKPVRQRKIHRKSRQGCGNCKLRSVKCDESKPSCKRCSASGFACNYTRAAPDLQLVHVGAFKLDLSPGPPPPNPGVCIPIVLPIPGRLGDYEMKPDDFAALDRFQKRTVLHIGTAATRGLFSHQATGLGANHPFLIHVFLALTLIHDNHLSPSACSPSHRSLLAFHWYHATVLLKQRLALPPSSHTSSGRDALWAASALLGAAAFAYVDTDDPARAWPLAEPDSLDLDWLRMSDGKKAVWDVVDPLRPDSAFHSLGDILFSNPPPDGRGPILIDALPPSFTSVFELNEDSTADNNPYYIPICILAHLLPLAISDHNMLFFLTFISQMGAEYKRRLADKDPRALLLLAWWYAKTCVAKAWWLQRRSAVEGVAICRFVQRECADDARMLELLEFPRGMLRMARMTRMTKLGMEEMSRVVDVTI